MAKAQTLALSIEEHTQLESIARTRTLTYARLTKHINETAGSAGYARLAAITTISIKNILDAAEIICVSD